MPLRENHYGKSRVRVLKVTREGGQHAVHEWTVGLYLTGDFELCFTEGDNTGLTATDTMKNMVYVAARNSAAQTMEAFAIDLAKFVHGRNPQVSGIRVTIEEKTWIRIKATTDGVVEKHPTAFMQRGPEVHFAEILLTPGRAAEVKSGVRGLVILKTAHSAFAGFKRDEFTTLPETHDRLLGTEATMMWTYTTAPPDFSASRTRLMDTLLTTFAQHDSLSVQQTLYAMAEAGLAVEPAISEMTLTMPNRHNLPVDLGRFGLDNPNSIFVPTDEPSGHIHARVTR